jgi:4-hydroxybenzoate polyprenyltransferase
MLDACGHLAVWPGLYAGGCVLFIESLTGGPFRWRPVAIAGFLTTGTYLLDRLGPWPSMPDRADLASTPERVRFLRRRVPHSRVLASAVLLASFALSLAEGVFAAALVPLAVLGMIGYAHPPGAWRLKDRLLLKNAVVAASMTAMAVVLVAFPGWPRFGATVQWAPLALAAAALFMHVMAGAMLCDLDDADSDARHGTRTLPNTIGAEKTWWCAEALTAAAGALTLLGVACGLVSPGLGVAIAGLPLAAVILLRAAGPMRTRDLVDVLYPIAVAAALLLAGWPAATGSSSTDAVFRALEESADVGPVPPEHEPRDSE